MYGGSPYEKILQECLRNELRLVNAGLPVSQKLLSDLLGEEYPHVVCTDGTLHLFKRRELEYCAAIAKPHEHEALLLPMIIEVGGGSAEAALVCPGRGEERIASTVLNMPVTAEQGRIRTYGPQLALLRKTLRTTIQYVFLRESPQWLCEQHTHSL